MKWSVVSEKNLQPQSPVPNPQSLFPIPYSIFLPMSQRTWIASLVLAGIVVLVQAALGVERRPATLDDTLLEGLGGKTMQELAPTLRDSKPQPPVLQTPSDGKPESPLAAIARRMREVESRISRADCGGQTLQAQQAILVDLDALIQQAKKSCGQCQSSGQKASQGVQQRKPVTQACNKPGDKPGQCQGKPGDKPGGSGKAPLGQADAKQPDARHADMNEMRALLKRLWGELPQRDREQMLQLPVEEFLPEYESLIEDYFRGLSEEKGARSESR